MSRWRRRAGSLVSIGALIASIGLACSERGGGSAGSSAGGDELLAPDFTLPALDGREVSLSSFRGKTVLMDFWATWCAPCVYQIPVLNEFHEEHRRDGVVVLGISVDVEGREVVAPFAEQHDIRYPVLLGTESVARRYGAPGFPSLVVVGPEGRIESVHVGLIERDVLEQIVRDVREPHPGAAPT